MTKSLAFDLYIVSQTWLHGSASLAIPTELSSNFRRGQACMTPSGRIIIGHVLYTFV